MVPEMAYGVMLDLLRSIAIKMDVVEATDLNHIVFTIGIVSHG